MKIQYLLLSAILLLPGSLFAKSLNHVMDAMRHLDSQGVAVKVWKNETQLDSVIKKLGNNTSGRLNPEELAKKLGKSADDASLIRSLGLLTDGERHVIGTLHDTIQKAKGFDAKNIEIILREAGPEGIYRASAMKGDVNKYFNGILLEGKLFNNVYDKGGKGAVNFYDTNFKKLRQKYPDDIKLADEVSKFKKTPGRYIDDLGRPTKEGKAMLERIKKIKLDQGGSIVKLKKLTLVVVGGIWAVATTLASGVAALLPLALQTASMIGLMAWGLLLSATLFVIKIILWVLTSLGLRKKRGDTQVTPQQEQIIPTPSSKTKSSGKSEDQKEAVVAKMPTEFPIMPDQESICIGLLGVRASGKSTFLVVLAENEKGRKEQIFADNDQATKETINQWKQDIMRFGRVKATAKHTSLFYKYFTSKNESYSFNIQDYPGEALKPKKEIPSEIANYRNWLNKNDGLILLLDPSREDEKDAISYNKNQKNQGSDEWRPVVSQEDVLPTLLANVVGDEGVYPHPVACVMTKLDTLPEDEQMMPAEELIEKYFPDIHSAVKKFAKAYNFLTISSTGSIGKNTKDLKKFKPAGISEPIFWLLEEMPQQTLCLIKKNLKKWKYKESHRILQSYLNRFGNAQTVSDAKQTLTNLKRKHRNKLIIYTLSVMVLIFLGGVAWDAGKSYQLKKEIDNCVKVAQSEPRQGLDDLFKKIDPKMQDVRMRGLTEHYQKSLQSIADLYVKEESFSIVKAINTQPSDVYANVTKVNEFQNWLDLLRHHNVTITFSEDYTYALDRLDIEKKWYHAVLPQLENETHLQKLRVLKNYLSRIGTKTYHQEDAKNRFEKLRYSIKAVQESSVLIASKAIDNNDWQQGIIELQEIKVLLVELNVVPEALSIIDSQIERLRNKESLNNFERLIVSLSTLRSPEEKYIKVLKYSRSQNLNVDVKQKVEKLLNEIESEWKDAILLESNDIITNNLYEDYQSWIKKLQEYKRVILNPKLNTPETLATLENLDTRQKEVFFALTQTDYDKNLRDIEFSENNQRKFEALNKAILSHRQRFPKSSFLDLLYKKRKSHLRTWDNEEYWQIYKDSKDLNLFKDNMIELLVHRMLEYLKRPFIDDSLPVSEKRKRAIEKFISYQQNLVNGMKFKIEKLHIDKLPDRTNDYDAYIQILIDGKEEFRDYKEDFEGKVSWKINEQWKWKKGMKVEIKIEDKDWPSGTEKDFKLKVASPYSLLLLRSPQKMKKWEDSSDDPPSIYFEFDAKIPTLAKP